MQSVKTLPNVKRQDIINQDATVLESIVRSGGMVPIMPQQVSQYPSYNIEKNTLTIMPIIYGQGGQQRPVVISGGGGGQQMMIPPTPPQGYLLNNVVKTMLLTNLAST